MSPPGRKPKPRALKIVEGNRGKRAIKAEPVPIMGPIVPPSWLGKLALAFWGRIEPQVSGMKVMTSADVDALALLCAAYEEYVVNNAIVEELGATYESRHIDMDEDGRVFERVIIRPRPQVAMRSDAWKRAKTMMVEFGLTPSARGRLSVGEAKGETECPRCGLPRDTMCGCG